VVGVTEYVALLSFAHSMVLLLIAKEFCGGIMMLSAGSSRIINCLEQLVKQFFQWILDRRQIADLA
jgi:hypothetical protein